MGNFFVNPFRHLWAMLWRYTYFLASHFDPLLHKILSIFSISQAEKTLLSMGLTEDQIIKGGMGLCVFILIFQLFWNHFLDVDNEQMGQNKLSTTIKKFIRDWDII